MTNQDSTAPGRHERPSHRCDGCGVQVDGANSDLCDECAEARAALPAGSSRARVTTANARWMRAAEERDRLLAQVDALAAQTAGQAVAS